MRTLSKFEKVDELTTRFNLSETEIARGAGVTPVTINCWQHRTESPRIQRTEGLDQLHRLALAWEQRGNKPPAFKFWLTAKQRRLEASPLDLLANRRYAEVERLL